MKQILSRFGPRGFDRGVSIFLSSVLLVFFLLLLVQYPYYTTHYAEPEWAAAANLFYTPNTSFDHINYFALIYLALAFLCFFLTRAFQDSRRLTALLGVTLVALIPRILMLVSFPTYLNGDVKMYVDMGSCFANGDLPQVANYVNYFCIPSFMGLSAAYGLLYSLFPSTVGIRLAHCLISAFTCGLVFLLGERYERRVGVVSALLFALYPSGIIASQLPINTHMQMFFLLLCVYLLLLALSARPVMAGVLAALSGFFLRLSYYLHSSALSTCLAVLLFLAVLILRSRKDFPTLRKLLCVFAAFLVLYTGTGWLGNVYFKRIGLYDLVDIQDNSSAYLFNIAVGFNPKNDGAISLDDAIWGEECLGQGDDEALRAVVRERLSNPESLPGFFLRKLRLTWMSRDCWQTFFKSELMARQRLEISQYTFSSYYKVVVYEAPLQGLCYTVWDAVDWYDSPTTRWLQKGSNHSPLQYC